MGAAAFGEARLPGISSSLPSPISNPHSPLRPLCYPQTPTLLHYTADRWGRLFTLLGGIVLEGILVILFGFVQNVSKHDKTTLWTYLFLRIGMGFGEATQNTVLLAYATDHFSASNQLGQVMGWQETAAGAHLLQRHHPPAHQSTT